MRSSRLAQEGLERLADDEYAAGQASVAQLPIP
jgi:hypothetical protein